MRADERTRTADLLITSELLYLLSYVGLCWTEYIVAVVRFKAVDQRYAGKRRGQLCRPWGLYWKAQDLVEGYGYPQLTKTVRRRILGEDLRSMRSCAA